MDKEYDFSQALKATDVPHLNAHRASQSNKSRITIMLDNDVVEGFKARAAKHGLGYQTEINQALRRVLEQGSLEEVIRRVVREEIQHS